MLESTAKLTSSTFHLSPVSWRSRCSETQWVKKALEDGSVSTGIKSTAHGNGQEVTFSVQQEKTWEEALEHCNENHSNFTSLLSKTENLLAMNEINKTGINEPVWIGLRYLGDRWLWLNGDPLVYQAWSQRGDQDQLCPVTRRCGALTKNGTWENRDCQEKLPFICA
uniref:C-type lectin domain-containing protein n=1 Tax=Nothobranchius furzeri TaxID=105023 RepID=A0A8C6LLT6_NOTFU